MAAIALSAFLLFTLELLAGRLVLPVFGGSAGVWTTALALFTGLLFCGYLYAHLVATRLAPRTGRLVHLTLAGVVLVATLLAPTDIASLRLPGTPEALNVLLALLLVAGPSAFLLATTTPLLSAWYAASGRDPWWLYALSNGVSFIALVGYPFVVERLLPLSVQRGLLVGGLAIYGAAVALAARQGGWGRARDREGDAAAASEADEETGPTLGRQARWLFAAFVPAGLLAATTNFIATDLISAPLLWVGPLGIYLASFVVAFSHRGRRLLPYAELLVPAAATLLWIPFVIQASLPVPALLLIELGAYAVLATAIHGRLALDRPADRHLTRFYLVLSAGGLLATAFVALVAPRVFSAVYEYPLLVVASLAALALLGRSGKRTEPDATGAERVRAHLRGSAIRLIPYAVLAGIVVALVGRADIRLAMAELAIVGGVLIALAWPAAWLAAATAVFILVFTLAFAPQSTVRVRDFFGVISVREAPGPAWEEASGTTVHGVQFVDERAHEPTTYYVRGGPLGDIFEDLRSRTNRAQIGVVGLGTGTIAAYAQATDSLSFFEIDQAVVDLAKDPRYFTYLRDSRAPARIVLGDGRLTLRAEPDMSFDLLVLDAFSSDAVPTHLLTREAMAEYIAKLRPGGVLAFHVSNRYYQLDGALTSTARQIGLEAVAREYQATPDSVSRLAAYDSEWVVVGRAGDIGRFTDRGWLFAGAGPVLSDDFSDILQTLHLQ